MNPHAETMVKCEPHLTNTDSEVSGAQFEHDKQQETLYQQNEAASRRKRKSIVFQKISYFFFSFSKILN